jgi:hypothetical protein
MEFNDETWGHLSSRFGGHSAGKLQNPGTGPVFGEKTHLAEKRSPENMDLSPSLRTPRALGAIPFMFS